VCKENERLKQKLTHPATHQAPGSVTPTTQVEAQRVAPKIERESAEFLELSPQQTAGPMQKVTRLAFPCPSTESSLSQEVRTNQIILIGLSINARYKCRSPLNTLR
jgi:hypothetical protein